MYFPNAYKKQGGGFRGILWLKHELLSNVTSEIKETDQQKTGYLLLKNNNKKKQPLVERPF